MNDDLLLVGEAQSVFTDEGDGEGDAVHGLLTTGPVNKLILSLDTDTTRRQTLNIHLCIYIKIWPYNPSGGTWLLQALEL